jgi:uncharacterized protein YbjT (DUF2867 family)
MKVLVIGSTGRTGSLAVKRLLDKGRLREEAVMIIRG